MVKPIIRVQSGEYTVDELHHKSIDELRTLLLEVDATIAEISHQLRASREEYAATGKSADWVWYKKADAAKAILSRQKIFIVDLIRKKRSVEGKPLAQHFLEVAREHMTRDSFDAVMAEALARKNEENARREPDSEEPQESKQEAPAGAEKDSQGVREADSRRATC